MWWQFKAGFARKIGYLLAAMLFAMLIGHRAHAQTCYVWVGKASATFPSDTAACSSYNQSSASGGVTVTDTYTSDGVTGSGASQSANCKLTEVSSGSCASSCGTNVTDPDLAVAVVSATCGPSACTAEAGMVSSLDVQGQTGGRTPMGGSTCASDGCSYTPVSLSTQLVVGAGGCTATNCTTFLMQRHSNTGTSCSPTASAPVAGADTAPGAASTTCGSVAGSVVCSATTSGGVDSGTVGGDVVTPSSMPPNGCVQYASGGVACVVPSGASKVSTPPGPDSGTVGTSATPDAVVTGEVPTTSGSLTPGTVDYYKAATVAKSKSPVISAGTGTLTGVNGTPAGTGNGSGSGTGVGACPPGQTCGSTTDSNSGGIDCAAPPTCTDTDPNVCGVMNQVWLERCATFTGAQLTGAIGTVTAVPQVAGGDFSAAVSDSGLITSGSGGTCPGPISFTFMGRTVSYDIWGTLCQFAGLISGIVIAVAYMFSARVMFSGVSSGFQQGG